MFADSSLDTAVFLKPNFVSIILQASSYGASVPFHFKNIQKVVFTDIVTYR